MQTKWLRCSHGNRIHSFRVSNGVMGHDDGTKGKGRRRHMLADVLGLGLPVYVRSASVQDQEGARTLWGRLAYSFSWLVLVWADDRYDGKRTERVGGRRHKIGLEIIKPLGVSGFVISPKRWIVERMIGWGMPWRWLRHDDKLRTDHSDRLIYIALMGVMTRRLARNKWISNTLSGLLALRDRVKSSQSLCRYRQAGAPRSASRPAP